MKNRALFMTIATLSMAFALFLALAYILFHEVWQMWFLFSLVIIGVGSLFMVEKIDKENINPELEAFCKMMGC